MISFHPFQLRRYLVAVLALGSVAAAAEGLTVSGTIAVNRAGASKSRVADSSAVVWLTPVEGEVHDALMRTTATGFLLTQQNKRFTPRILVVPVGATVEFPNLDPFFHNVFSLFDGKRFDLGLYESGTAQKVRFDRPGVCYIFCNIHPEMNAVVVVVKTPYFAISNRAGEFRVPSVPPGRYIVSVWHETAQPEASVRYPREISITAENASLGTIRLVQSDNLLGPHKNKYGHYYERPAPPGMYYGQR